MLNEVISLPNGDFEVLPLVDIQRLALENLRAVRYGAAQRNEYAVVSALDEEIGLMLKRIG